jgi:hypothetical protein
LPRSSSPQFRSSFATLPLHSSNTASRSPTIHVTLTKGHRLDGAERAKPLREALSSCNEGLAVGPGPDPEDGEAEAGEEERPRAEVRGGLLEPARKEGGDGWGRAGVVGGENEVEEWDGGKVVGLEGSGVCSTYGDAGVGSQSGGEARCEGLGGPSDGGVEEGGCGGGDASGSGGAEEICIGREGGRSMQTILGLRRYYAYIYLKY